MSAILGVVAAPGAVPADGDLAAMRDAASFWGADGERWWSGRDAALGHLLQRVTCSRGGGPTGAALPERDGVVVAADVRLDNRDELAGLLCAGGAHPPSDEELVLRAYLRFAEGCAERLVGAFAFAVWDGPRRRLVCVRDHAGFRPLAYWNGPAGFVFATDPQTVVAHGSVPVEPDEAARVARFASYPALLRERSPYAGVAKLPAGELLVVEPGGPPRRRRHWVPERLPRRRFRTADDCARALRETLTTAGAAAVASDAGVGVHLSGGLDSSAAAVVSGRALAAADRSVRAAYCWAPPPSSTGRGDTEHARLEAVAAAIGAPVSYTTLAAEDLRAEAARAEGQEPSEMLVYEEAVLRRAAADGVGVLVTGWGGDEAASFNGRGQLAWSALRGRWRALWHEASAPARGRGPLPVARTAARNIRRGALVPLLPDAVYRAVGLGESELERELERRGHGWATVHPAAPGQRRDMRVRARVRPSVRATQITRLSMGHLEQRIEAWAAAGARAGVDHRYPLLDRRVIELSLALPGDVWIRDGWSRWIFRKAVAPLLPSTVVWTHEKAEPARMDSWLELLRGARLDEVSGTTPLVRAHRRRQQETARILSER